MAAAAVPTAAVGLPLDELLDELRLAGICLNSAQETRLRALALLDEPLFTDHLVEYLNTLCDYPQFAARTLDKQQTLARKGVLQPSLDDLPLDSSALVTWYRQRQRRPLPQDPDACSLALGFADAVAFYRALAGEYLYIT